MMKTVQKLVKLLPFVLLLALFFTACNTGNGEKSDDTSETGSVVSEASSETSDNTSSEASAPVEYAKVPEEIVAMYSSYDISASANSKGSIATAEEKADCESFFKDLFGNMEDLPISFKLGDKEYHGFNDEFEICVSDGVITAKHTSGLCVIISYGYNFEYSAFEWAVYFKNESDKDTAVLSDVYVADMEFKGEDVSIEYMTGESYQDTEGYAKRSRQLLAGANFTLESGATGKSTYQSSPYQRLFFGEGGVSIALGWQGRWKMNYKVSKNDAGETLTRFRAGQFLFSSYLKPGEEVRTPRVSMIKYLTRDEYHAINMWRRWFLDCAYYRYNDEIVKPIFILSDSGITNVYNASERKVLDIIKNLPDNNVEESGFYTNIWCDAGWYLLTRSSQITTWEQVGTWKMDTNRYPSSLKKVSDAMNAKGGITNLWFEPERVYTGTELYGNEEWTIAAPIESNTVKLLNFGLTEVQDWWVDTVDKIMTKGGISMYRQDFNMFPWQFYLSGDGAQGAGRSGITEALHINGITECYKRIMELHPEFPIDMCASGGCRNDMDALRISEMFTLSDCSRIYSTQMQNRRLEMYCWSPFTCGACADGTDYNYISNLSYNMCYSTDRYLEIWKQVKDLFLCDYYPLTEWTSSDNAWCAMEFYDTELKQGFVEFMRRPESTADTMTYKLYGFDASKNYQVINLFDMNDTKIVSGAELLENGMTVTLGTSECAAYKFIEQ